MRPHTIDVFVRPEMAHAPSELRTVRGNVAQRPAWMDWLQYLMSAPTS
jgi:hypothetical protein